MAFLAPVQSSPDYTCIIVTYRTPRKDVPVYVVSTANSWKPEEMHLWLGNDEIERTMAESEILNSSVDDSKKSVGVEFAKIFKVPRSTGCIKYKFRVGEGEWVWDEARPTEHDGFGGMNNRFDIPAELPLTPPPDQFHLEDDNLHEHMVPDESMYLEPDSQTALPSPVATPRDIETDSGTEIEAPSVSDWEPTEADELISQSNASTYAMSEAADWEIL